MDIPAAARLGRVDVCVRVDPDDANLAAQTLAQRARGAANRADGDAVVSAEGQHEAALRGVVVHLVCDAARHGGHGARVLHAAVGGVEPRLGDEVRVQVDGVVAVQLVVELVAELGEEAGLDEGRGGGVNTGLALVEGTC